MYFILDYIKVIFIIKLIYNIYPIYLGYVTKFSPKKGKKTLKRFQKAYHE